MSPSRWASASQIMSQVNVSPAGAWSSASWRRASHAQGLGLERREQGFFPAIGLARLAAIVRSLGPLLLQTTEG